MDTRNIHSICDSTHFGALRAVCDEISDKCSRNDVRGRGDWPRKNHLSITVAEIYCLAGFLHDLIFGTSLKSRNFSEVCFGCRQPL